MTHSPAAPAMSWPLRLLKAFLDRAFRLLFRIEVNGLEHCKAAGDTAIMVSNHQSYLDAPILAAVLPGRVSFAINHFTAEKWWIRPSFALVRVFRVDPTKPFAMNTIIKRMRHGGHCVIFPEGRLTETGALMKIYDGPAVVADKLGCPVLPIRIEGLEHSIVSTMAGRMRQRLFPKVSITVLAPQQLTLPPEAKGRRRRQLAGAWLYDLMSDAAAETGPRNATLFAEMLAARARHGGKMNLLEDINWRPMTYDRLRIGSMILGRKLAAVSTPRETVGILLPNALGTVVAFFGLTGFARVPAMLNYTVGATNLISACATAGIKTVITSRLFIQRGHLEDLVDALSQHVTLVYLEDVRDGVSRGDKLRGLVDAMRARAVHRSFAVRHSDPAVILFTSGSEGAPKGVVLSHDNILANCRQARARLDFNPTDKVLNVLPMFHSFGLTVGTIMPIVFGVRLFLYPSPLHYRLVPEMAYASKATIMFGADTFLAGYGRAANAYDFCFMRYVLAGAEPLREETRRLWMDKFGIRILEGYGVTETAPALALNTPMHYRAGTVGRILPHVKTRVEPIEGISTGGRLHVSGPNVMLGYLSAQKPGELLVPPDGWHDTGDIVDIDRHGFIKIIGRVKRFAKIAGEMVSLAAVEAVAVSRWPDHMHAAIALPDGRKGEQIVLITTCPEADRAILTEHTRATGHTELMVPKSVVAVDDIPLLATGKIDYVKVRSLGEHRLADRAAA